MPSRAKTFHIAFLISIRGHELSLDDGIEDREDTHEQKNDDEQEKVADLKRVVWKCVADDCDKDTVS